MKRIMWLLLFTTPLFERKRSLVTIVTYVPFLYRSALSQFPIVCLYDPFCNNNVDCLIIKATDWVFHTGPVCHVWCNLESGYTCRTATIFGHWKIVVWKLIACHYIIVSDTERLAKWRQCFVKMTFKKSIFWSKSSLHISDHTIWFKCRQYQTVRIK